MKVFMPNMEKYDLLPENYIQVNSCGRQSNCDYRIIRKNGRLDYHLLYIFSGCCTVKYNGSSVLLQSGNFVLYAPGQVQDYSFPQESCTTFWLHFTGKALDKILKELSFAPGVYHCPASQKITAVFDELIREFRLRHHMPLSAENALLLHLLTRLSQQISTSEDSSDIEKIIMLMHDNYNANYSCKDLAELCALSQSRFSHKFKEITGSSPIQFFIGLKIQYAQELLIFSDMSVTQIAGNVGYRNPLYFSRIFTKITGISPTAYRKIYKTPGE